MIVLQVRLLGNAFACPERMEQPTIKKLVTKRPGRLTSQCLTQDVPVERRWGYQLIMGLPLPALFLRYAAQPKPNGRPIGSAGLCGFGLAARVYQGDQIRPRGSSVARAEKICSIAFDNS